MPDTSLLFVGDPHGDFTLLAAQLAVESPAAVILMGDQTPKAAGQLAALEASAPTAIHYILGNHDTDQAEYLERHIQELPADRDLGGGVIELKGVRVAALGGVFRGRVWHPEEAAIRHRNRQGVTRITQKGTRYRGGPPLVHWSSIYPDEWDALARQRADILVTHEAPEAHPKGFRVIGDLARALGVHTVIHGHHHRRYSAEIDGGIRVVGLGYGYQEDGLYWLASRSQQ